VEAPAGSDRHRWKKLRGIRFGLYDRVFPKSFFSAHAIRHRRIISFSATYIYTRVFRCFFHETTDETRSALRQPGSYRRREGSQRDGLGDLHILSFYHITISISHLMKRRRCLFLMLSIL
jgi:hypothetical protein